MRRTQASTSAHPASRNFTPLIGPLWERRSIAFWLTAIALTHLLLADAGHALLVCPFRVATGDSCPGCGLTTASLHLLHGEWGQAFATHAFAPAFLVLGVMTLAVALAGARLRAEVAAHVSAFERKTGAAFLGLIAVVLYWLLRRP